MKKVEAERAAADSEPMRSTVRFTRLSLTDFRSWKRLELDLDGRPVVLAGANGAGKTNVLEALSLIGPGRGLRHARLDELPRLDGGGGWAVAARISQAGDDLRLGVGAAVASPDRRECRIEETTASGPAAFAEFVRFLWLTPAQDRLFVEGASERRRFLDRMTQARDPGHARMAADFDLAMRQRQKLLEARSKDDAWLGGLEERMAEAGVAIAAARRETAAALAAANIVDDCDEACAFPSADIAIEGVLETALERIPAAEVETDYAARLREARRADTEAGRALLGPHRSDLVVAHREKKRPARLCSTGEQKGLLAGLVLANARALALQGAFRGRTAPLVLLLDEIAAHFDEERRRALFDILDGLGFQIFMTGTDQSSFAGWGDRAQAFQFESGAVRETRLD